MKIDIFGVKFDSLSMKEAVERALTLIDNRAGAYITTPNAAMLNSVCSDGELIKVINSADLVLPDGISIIKAAKILGTPLRERIPGIDFAKSLLHELSKRGGSVFLFGALPGVAQKAAERLVETYEGISISGVSDGYDYDDKKLVSQINESKPDFLIVCLGFPKQEQWMFEHSGKLRLGVMAGLGGSMDVFAGTVKRAPPSWQKLGFEWLYRLLKEPRRLGQVAASAHFMLKAIFSRGDLSAEQRQNNCN